MQLPFVFPELLDGLLDIVLVGGVHLQPRLRKEQRCNEV